MLYTPEQVRDRVARLWPTGHSAALGDRWAATMQDRVDRALASFATGEGTPNGGRLAAAIRAATSFRAGRIPTLYVTERFLRERDDATDGGRLTPDERGCRFEHVVPLQFTLPGGPFARDPHGALAAPDAPALADLPWLNRVARALVTPVCFVSRHEDVRLARRTHPDWTHPFARYVDPAVVRHAPDAAITAYDTYTGEAIVDPAAFTWADHLRAMARSPLHAPVARMVERHFTGFADREPALYAAMADRPGAGDWPDAPAPGPRRGWYSEDEQRRLRAFLSQLAAAGPRAGATAAMEVPVNASRVTMTVRHPRDTDRLLLRVNIGPDHGKRELYFNDRDMHGAGRGWIERIARAVNADPHGCRLVPQTSDGDRRAGLTIRYDRGDRRPHVERVEAALGRIVPVMRDLYREVAAG